MREDVIDLEKEQSMASLERYIDERILNTSGRRQQNPRSSSICYTYNILLILENK